MATGPPLNIS